VFAPDLAKKKVQGEHTPVRCSASARKSKVRPYILSYIKAGFYALFSIFHPHIKGKNNF
jgi:hypothetical protein